MSHKPEPIPKDCVRSCAKGDLYLHSPHIASLILALVLAICGLVKLAGGLVIVAVVTVGFTVKELFHYARRIQIDDEKLGVTTSFGVKEIPWSAVSEIKLRFFSPIPGWTQYAITTDRGQFTLPMSLDDADQLVTAIADRISRQSHTQPLLVGMFSEWRVAGMWACFLLLTAFSIAISVYVVYGIMHSGQDSDVLANLGGVIVLLLCAGGAAGYTWWALSDLVIYASMSETQLELRSARKRSVLTWDRTSQAKVTPSFTGLSIETASGSKFALPERIDYYDVLRASLADRRFIGRSAAPRD